MQCKGMRGRNAELGLYQLIMIIYVLTQAVFSDGDLALCCDLEWAQQRAESSEEEHEGSADVHLAQAGLGRVRLRVLRQIGRPQVSVNMDRVYVYVDI